MCMCVHCCVHVCMLVGNWMDYRTFYELNREGNTLYSDVQEPIVWHFSKGLDWTWGDCEGILKGIQRKTARFGLDLA